MLFRACVSFLTCPQTLFNKPINKKSLVFRFVIRFVRNLTVLCGLVRSPLLFCKTCFHHDLYYFCYCELSVCVWFLGCTKILVELSWSRALGDSGLLWAHLLSNFQLGQKFSHIMGYRERTVTFLCYSYSRTEASFFLGKSTYIWNFASIGVYK